MSNPDHAERLHSAAAAARTLLENSPVERWEVFAKASFAREVEVATGRPLRVINVEETGVAVRSLRDGRAGFAAASGLGSSASRRAVEGAFATETAVTHDPLPPRRLLGTTEVRGARPLPPTGWATHVGEELARAVTNLADGRLRLRRAIIQEGAFSWILATGDDWVARHDGTVTSLLAEIEGVGDRAGVWRDWLHINDPDAFDVEAAAVGPCPAHPQPGGNRFGTSRSHPPPGGGGTAPVGDRPALLGDAG